MSEQSQPVVRTLSGIVVSNAADKTITVRIDRRVKHALYGKYMRRMSRIHAHDENNDCNVGDKVSIVECRPISKSKSWRLHAIEERSREV